MAGSELSQNQVRQRPPNADSFAASPTPILSTWMGPEYLDGSAQDAGAG